MGEPLSAQPIRVLGRYALYGEIASGGMATVHFGRLMGPVGFARTVAIKRLHPQYAKDPEFVSMFLDEARLAARIRHPNVVPTLDVVALEGELFLVMDYVQGESLARLIRTARDRHRTIPLSIAAPLMAGVLHGLHAAHEAKNERGEPLGIVHRDVSPHNVLVGIDGVARVLDFGVAKAAGRVQTTREGQLKGKLPYMAPEQITGVAGRATDVYAAAAVLWEVLTTRRLFDADNEGKVLAKIMKGTVEPPSAYAPGLPAALDELTLRGLERELDKRFPTARDMARALERSTVFAPASDIGEWVEEMAGQRLAQRAERVAQMESASYDYVRPSQPVPRSNPPDVALAPEAMDAMLETTVSSPPTEEPHFEPSPARHSAPVLLAVPAPSDSLPTQLSSGSVSAPRPRFSIRPQVRYGFAIAVAAGLGVGLLVVAFVGWHRVPSSSAGDRASANAPTATSELAAPQAPMDSTGGAAPAPPAQPPPTQAASADVPPPPPAQPPTTAQPTATSPATTARIRRLPPPAPTVNCNPPFTVDSAGYKHYKRECLK